MSKELEARVLQLEIIVTSLLDEITEIKLERLKSSAALPATEYEQRRMNQAAFMNQQNQANLFAGQSMSQQLSAQSQLNALNNSQQNQSGVFGGLFGALSGNNAQNQAKIV